MKFIGRVAYQSKHVREVCRNGRQLHCSPRSWSSFTTLLMSFLSFLYSMAFSLSSGGRLRRSCV